MKRSDINKLIEDAIQLLHKRQIRLPPFAYWTPEGWHTKGSECNEIRTCKLGWDITDFGSGNFEKVGLVVFTVRNGHHSKTPFNQKVYAEKILVVQEHQHTPMHHHIKKTEDIICKSGGIFMCQVYNRNPDGSLADSDVEVSLDGIKRRVPAGHIFAMKPGESITLPPYLFHDFWAEGGTTILGEVSSVNDDDTDNVFLSAGGRFPMIEEDEPSRHMLCTEY